jgi:hypothetical protein
MAAPPLEQEEREWLIERTTELIAAAGWQHYVRAPLLLPDERSFPDRWTPDLRGLRVLALRLLAYAGLVQLDVDIVVYEGDRATELDAHGHERVSGHQGAAAWFAGIEDGVCLFGCDVGQLQDPIGVVGAMAHEVAHAFRRFHALEVDDRDLEERLTDLTTVYLGFGVLSTNAALRHRSSLVGENLFAHQWSHSQLGYLPAAAMSFLLAMWWLVRGDDRAGARQIERVLETNQSAWFRGALGWLRKQPRELAYVLGLPLKERWPKPLELGAVTVREQPQDDDDDDDDDDQEEEEDDDESEVAEGVVFMVLRRRPWEQPRGKLVWISLLAAAGWLTGSIGIGVSSIVGALLWLLWGSTWHDHCSDPACDHQLTPTDAVCPGCHRRIAGAILHRDERLAAEERFQEAESRKHHIKY